MTTQLMIVHDLQTMSRTYAQAVAGVATKMKFDPDSLNFSLEYTVSDACSSTLTEVSCFASHQSLILFS